MAPSSLRPLSIAALATLVGAAALALSACPSSTTKGSAGGGRTPPDEPWRERRPAPGPAPELKLPAFQQLELKNGLTVFVVEERSVPMLTAAVVVRAGAAQETAKEAGLASLTYDLLDEGVAGLDQLAFANALADIGSKVSVNAGREAGTVRMELLKKHVDDGLKLLAAMVQKPTFAAADFDRVQAQQLSSLKEKEGEPGAIAESLAAALEFGAEHPYGHDADGTPQTIDKITAARAKKFWADNFGPKNAALILLGDVNAAEAEALAQKHFGKWAGAGKPPKAPADPKAHAATKLALVDIPGAQQTAVRIGRPLLPRGDADEPAMIVLNEIVGGSFSSRINLKLREEKQWTYGAFSSIEGRLGKGPFTVRSAVQTPNTADAVAEVLAIFDALKKDGVTDDELAFAKEGYAKSMPGTLGLPPAQVRALTTIFAYNLPIDYYAQLLQKVGAVTKDDVKKAAERALVKEDLVVAMVGDRQQVEAALKAKGFTDVGLYNRDGTEAK